MATLTGYKRDSEGIYIDKDTEAKLDYTLDWSNWLQSGVTISSVTYSFDSISGDTTPITIVSSNDNTTTTAVIDGGTAGNIYTVYAEVTLDNTNKDRRSFRVSVKDRSL